MNVLIGFDPGNMGLNDPFTPHADKQKASSSGVDFLDPRLHNLRVDAAMPSSLVLDRGAAIESSFLLVPGLEQALARAAVFRDQQG